MDAPKFAVGQIVEWHPRHINKRVNAALKIDVIVESVKTSFGRYIYEVRPVSGKGTDKVNEDGLKLKA